MRIIRLLLFLMVPLLLWVGCADVDLGDPRDRFVVEGEVIRAASDLRSTEGFIAGNANRVEILLNESQIKELSRESDRLFLEGLPPEEPPDE